MAELKIQADSGGGTVSFKGPATTTDDAAVQLTLPVDDGAANTWLKSNGSGVTSWAAPTATEIATSSGTAGSGTFLRGDNTWAAPSGGISEFDQWRLSANTSGDHDPLSSNLERVDTDGFAAKGSGMSVSSGIWTFPSTGWWLCDFTFLFYANASTDGNMYGNIQVTTDNSSYTDRLEIVMFAAANDHGVSGNGKLILDVTDVSNVKLKIKITQANNSDMIQGNTDRNLSHFTFLKLAET